MFASKSFSGHLWTLALLIAGGLMLAGCSDQSALTQANEPMLSTQGGPGGPGGPPPGVGGPGNGNGSHAKATGEVKWVTNSVTRWAEFNAHDDAPGTPSDRGTLEQGDDASSPGYFKVDVQCVEIDGNEAWFGGPTVEGANTGDFRVTHVVDGGTPGTNGDTFEGAWKDAETCETFDLSSYDPGPDKSFAVTEGNLKVHN